MRCTDNAYFSKVIKHVRKFYRKKGVHERLLRRCFRQNSAEFGLPCHMKRVCMCLCVNCKMKSNLENLHALIFCLEKGQKIAMPRSVTQISVLLALTLTITGSIKFIMSFVMFRLVSTGSPRNGIGKQF